MREAVGAGFPRPEGRREGVKEGRSEGGKEGRSEGEKILNLH